MATVRFTSNLERFVTCLPQEVGGETVAQTLDAVFSDFPALRGYLLDDQDRLRKHVTIFVDGQMIKDQRQLSDKVKCDSKVYVMQALSGG